VPILENYRTFRVTVPSNENAELEPDFDERSYFHFISRHLYKATSEQ
jgi:hypothetical protein